MGAHPYYYFVEYQPDFEAALQELRQREFEAGRYNPAQPFPDFPIRAASPAPGTKHESIYEAIEDAAEDGTRSILEHRVFFRLAKLRCRFTPFRRGP